MHQMATVSIARQVVSFHMRLVILVLDINHRHRKLTPLIWQKINRPANQPIVAIRHAE